MIRDRKDARFWAEWLVDAIACSTQNRIFLKGDPEEDKIATESIYLNALKAINNFKTENEK